MPYHIEIMQQQLLEKKNKNRRYSLRAFARDLNVPVSILSKIFNGKVKISIVTAMKVAQKMNFDEQLTKDFVYSVAKQWAEGANGTQKEAEQPS